MNGMIKEKMVQTKINLQTIVMNRNVTIIITNSNYKKLIPRKQKVIKGGRADIL